MSTNFFAKRPVDPERDVQLKVLQHLEQYCHFTYIGFFKNQDNEPIRRETLAQYLKEQQHCSDRQAREAINKLLDAAHCVREQDLYAANKEVYNTLRYGVSVSTPQNTHTTKWLIDWEHPQNNIYEVAEEVSVPCSHPDINHLRPDVVLYVNGIALVVLELKKSTVSAKDAIRQHIRNQEYIPSFFAVPQLLLAGNPSEGLYYATTKTPEKYWLHWKEPTGQAYPDAERLGGIAPRVEPEGERNGEFGGIAARIEPNRNGGNVSLWDEYPPFSTRFSQSEIPNELYRSLMQMLTPPRLLEFIHDLTVFDGGVKKVGRPNQYFALKAVQQRVKRRQGGIIWHSQGSGKSLSMVWMAQWIKETQENARVVIITDRDELDKQITNGFIDAGERPYRATSGSNLLDALDHNEHHLICTLIHKFGSPANKDIAPNEILLRGERNVEQYMEALARNLPKGFKAKGNIFVFIDECHRTQGGLLNKAMKAIMGEDVMMIGFTGTPLLKSQKGVLNSYENFGPYIHTYKFDEAVEDGVILDLRYEARNIEQDLSDSTALDKLFETQTQGLTPKAKEELQSRWATMQNIYSSRDRKTKIVKSIQYDFLTVPCFRGHWGNAILVASSIYDAFNYWELFMQNIRYHGHVAVVSSLDAEMPGLDEAYSGESESEQEYKQRMLKQMCGDTPVKEFEESVKTQFVKEPGKMWLLIVVDKLLTGFDAPTATYLYIDKKMEDHNLFQAICRVNRIAEQKEYGYIVDFKQLFESIEGAISDYTNGAFSGYEAEDVKGLMQSQIVQGRKDLEVAQERCRLLAEPVAQPRKEDNFFDYFGFNQAHTPADEQEAEIIRNAQKRDEFYDACNHLVRTFRAISMQMNEAGYTSEEAAQVLREVKYFDDVRIALMHRCGDYLDLKRYDAEMRALLDDYIEAHDAVKMNELSDFSFLELITEDTHQEDDVQDVVESMLGGENGVAETIAANVRRVINRKKESNPDEYQRFSERLNRLLEERKQAAIDYHEFLNEIRQLIEELRNQKQHDPRLDTEGKISLYENCGYDIEFALVLYDTIKQNAKHNFRNNHMRRQMLLMAIRNTIIDHQKADKVNAEKILSIVIANEEF